MACAENGLAVVTDFLWKNRSVTVYLVPTDQENADPRVIFEYSSEDLYWLPGTFITVPRRGSRRPPDQRGPFAVLSRRRGLFARGKSAVSR